MKYYELGTDIVCEKCATECQEYGEMIEHGQITAVTATFSYTGDELHCDDCDKCLS